MYNNDILRRLRYAFDYNDPRMLEIFKLGGIELTRTALLKMLKKDEDGSDEPCDDKTLCMFFDGLITDKRGAQDPSKKPAKPNYDLDNNIILRKLKIAMAFDSQQMIDVFKLARFEMSKPQLTGLFRRKNHRNFDACTNQMLVVFIKGLTIHLRGDENTEKPKPQD